MYVPFHDKSSIWSKEMTRQLSSQGAPGIIKKQNPSKLENFKKEEEKQML
jgi:hypothetical protein